MTYDDDGELLTTTDARGQTLAYTYDSLGRKTGEFDGSPAGTQLARWVYDTVAKGHLTSETRFVDGNAYTSTVLGYTADGLPSATRVSILASEGALAGSYLYLVLYSDDGQPTEIDLPVTGGLPNETLTYRYDDLGNPSSVESGLPNGVDTLVTGATYTQLGEPARFTLSNGGVTAFLSYSYQESTQRLTGSKVELGGNPVPVSDATYAYDPAGNVTKSTDTSTVNGYPLPKGHPTRVRALVAATAQILGAIPAHERHYYTVPELLLYACDALGTGFCDRMFRLRLNDAAQAAHDPICATALCRAAALGAGYGMLSGSSGGEPEEPNGELPITSASGQEKFAAESDSLVEVEFRSDTSHIFRNARGHLNEDTQTNRELIRRTLKPKNLRSTITLKDGPTLDKYFETLPDGSQVWETYVTVLKSPTEV